MPDTGAIRILLVEDHTLVREILARSLAQERDFEVAGQCGTIDSALDAVLRLTVNIVLLDINLGTEQGGSFVTRAYAAGFEGKVLVLTAGVGEREAAWLLKRGCAGIFLKDQPASALVTRIREVAQGTAAPVATPTHFATPQWERPVGSHKPLTPRECAVLRAVCEGLANKEIAERLAVSENTVKSFLQQLFDKIGVRTRAQLVAKAIERYWDQM